MLLSWLLSWSRRFSSDLNLSLSNPPCLSPPVCKFVSIEMKSAFDETGKTKEVIDRNYGFIDNKGAPPIKYVKSWVCLCALVAEKSCLRTETQLLSPQQQQHISLPVRLRIGKLLYRQRSSSLQSQFWQLWRAQCCCWQIVFALHAHNSSYGFQM